MTTADAQHLLRILGDLDRFLTETLDPVLRNTGIGREHWQVLRLLADGQGHAMGEIAQSAGLPGATATRMVDLLAANMLVYRRNDPLDRRRVLVHLSDVGFETLRRIDEGLSDHTSEALTSFSSSDRDKLVELLERLVQVEAN